MASNPTRDGLEEKAAPSTVSGEDPRVLTEKAQRCRRLAAGISDKQASDVLTALAKKYEAAAGDLPAKD